MSASQNNLKPGTIISADVTVDQSKEVRDFYKKVIGWGHSEYRRGDASDYFMTTSDGQPVAGICQKSGSLADLPSVWLVYFGVSNLAVSLDECRKLGGKVLTEPQSMAQGSYAVIEYPEGSICALSQL